MNLEVFDGMRGKLTQAHIDKGVRDMCRECPSRIEHLGYACRT